MKDRDIIRRIHPDWPDWDPHRKPDPPSPFLDSIKLMLGILLFGPMAITFLAWITIFVAALWITPFAVFYFALENLGVIP